MAGKKKNSARQIREIAADENFFNESEDTHDFGESKVQDDRNHSLSDYNPGLAIINFKLTASNYLSWSRSMVRALKVKGKSEFILKDSTAPTEDNAIEFQKWTRDDNLVISWILNAMDFEIAESFQYASSARELWMDLKHRYGDVNGPMIYKVRKEISQTTQGDLSVLQYFNKLKKLWEELNFLSPTPSCQCGASKTCNCNAFQRVSDALEEEHLMQFLLGLNEVYDHIKDQILLQDPLPSINKAYSMLLTVEKQQEISSSQHAIEIASFVKSDRKSEFRKKKHDNEKEPRYCSICNTNKHAKNNCFRVIGYPDWWKGPREPLVSSGSGSKSRVSTLPLRINPKAQ